MAMIVFNPRWKNKRAMAVPADKALTILEQLKDPTDLSEEQLDFLKCIQHVYLNNRAVTLEERSEPLPEEKLYHEGIAQSMYDAVPTGDR